MVDGDDKDVNLFDDDDDDELNALLFRNLFVCMMCVECRMLLESESAFFVLYSPQWGGIRLVASLLLISFVHSSPLSSERVLSCG